MDEVKRHVFNYKIFLICLISFAVLTMGIVFAAVSSQQLTVSGTALADGDDAIYIYDVTCDDTLQGSVTVNSAALTFLDTDVTLSSSNSSSYVRCKVDVYNNTDKIYKYEGVIQNDSYYIGSNGTKNNDIEYVVSGITTTTLVKQAETASFYITYQYKSGVTLPYDNTLSSNLMFDFLEMTEGTAEITSITCTGYHNVTSHSETLIQNGVDLDIYFDGNDTNYYIEYSITITNNTFSDYRYVTMNFNLDLQTGGKDGHLEYAITGISEGENIPALTAKTFTARITLVTSDTGSYSAGGESEVGVSTDSSGELTAEYTGTTSITLPDTTTKIALTADIENTFKESKQYLMLVDNNKFELVDSSGVAITAQSIDDEDSETYTFYIKLKNDYSSLIANDTVHILFRGALANDETIATISATIPINATVDEDPPQISGVTITQVNATTGRVNITWNATDDSTITGYKVYVYNASDDSLFNSYTINSDTKTQAVTGLTDGSTYYAVVTGIDSEGNEGSNANPTTGTGEASKSANTKVAWIFSVSKSGSNVSWGGTNANTTSIRVGSSYNLTITASGSNRYISSVTVTMGGETLSGVYTESSNQKSGTVSISSVTGNITIAVETDTCLKEGTLILLADGTYKKVEDIRYDDLLLVYNYETGEFTQEYPIWIEHMGVTNKYMRSTFSDGTILETVGYHGVFSVDALRFVDVLDSENYHVGTRIYKYDNGTLKEVTVENIEFIYEEVNYYQVVSTTYYNVIANDVITTDGNIILVNIYGFDENMMWQLDRHEIINDPFNVFTYEELEECMPYYMYIGLRANEVKYIINQYGVDEETLNGLKSLLTQYNEELLLEYPTVNGVRYFVVSDSLGNKEYVEEGYTYTTRTIDGVIGWLDTGSGKVYSPGETIQVNLSTHLVAIYY